MLNSFYHISILLALSCAVLLPGLGACEISDTPEARQPLVARNMMASGDYLMPYLFNAPYYNKPPLFSWLTVLSFRVLGDTALAARLPSALSGIALILMIYAIGRESYNDRVGFWAGLMAATVPAFLLKVRLAEIEVFFSLLITVSVFCLYLGLASGRGGWIWIVAGHFVSGLAVMAKGPMGWIIPLIVVSVYVTFFARHAANKRWLLYGIPLGLAPPLVWLLMLELYGQDVLAGYWAAATFETVTKHQKPFYYYLYQFPILLLPWFFYLMPALRARRSTDPTGVAGATATLHSDHPREGEFTKGRTLHKPRALLAIWMILPFVMFSLSPSKQSHYLLPILPPAMVMLAALIFRVFLSHPKGSAAPPAQVLRVGVLVMTVILAASAFASGIYDLQVGPAWPMLLAGGMIILLGMITADAFNRRNWFAGSGLLVVYLAVTMITVLGLSHPFWVNEQRNQNVKALHQVQLALRGRPLLTNDGHEYFNYHLQTSPSLVYTLDELREAWTTQPDALFLATGRLSVEAQDAGCNLLMRLFDFPKRRSVYVLLACGDVMNETIGP